VNDISVRQHCAPTTMLMGNNCMCQQSIFHVSAQIVFGLVEFNAALQRWTW
jgi:hypothetical protein